ncbi:MAG: cation-translocating P-type ATPase [Candidatus Binatia bacterium]
MPQGDPTGLPASPPSTDAPPWHTLPAPEAAERLRVDPALGLSAAEAERRRERYGPNELHERRGRSPWRMLLGQFTDFMIVVLMVAAIVSGLIGDPEDTVAILVIVVLNGTIGFIQEYRAERAVAALRLLAAPTAAVRRGGTVLTAPARELVPGDVVLLEAGNVVPADLRLLESVQFRVEEAALTGESVPVEKVSEALGEADLPLGDRVNMAYKGTTASYGRAVGAVVATGMHTELGKIAALLSRNDERRTPLQQRLTQFGQRLALAAIAVCVIVFAFGLLRGEPIVLMFLTAISLAVAAIPEALPAVVTVSLALGARRMVKQHALIRRLPAVETLGSVTYICSDKTGTLTQNKMRVEQVYADGLLASTPPRIDQPPWQTLYRAIALSNDALAADPNEIRGDPTEVALYRAATAVGFDKAALSAEFPRIAEVPFDSTRKCMTTLHRDTGGVLAFTKGAPEHVVAQCETALCASGTLPLQTPTVLARAEEMAAAGLRVLAVACRAWSAVPDDLSSAGVEQRLTFVGLVGLLDPPREEARAAVALCKSAGITPVMITGDHPTTARAIAARLAITDNDAAVLTGQELNRLPADEMDDRVGRVRVYARVAPEQKITIVKALQEDGEFVAMTGDGVNDAPALKQADIGVAMGQVGTDVAREAADMILLDDNFATIVAAVREGRRIFDNTRKFIRYAVTCNSGEIWTIFLAPFLGLPIPLLPIHILWINLVTDGLPGLALAVEPHERGVMQRPPRPPQESIFAHGMWQHILWVGLLMAGMTLLTQAWAYHTGSAHWQTMVFTVLALSQMGHVLAIRSETQSLFRQGLWSNRPLLGAVLLTTALQLATIYPRIANPIFKTEPLSVGELAICLAASSVVFVAVEIEKWMVRRGWLYRVPPARAARSRVR